MVKSLRKRPRRRTRRRTRRKTMRKTRSRRRTQRKRKSTRKRKRTRRRSRRRTKRKTKKRTRSSRKRQKGGNMTKQVAFIREELDKGKEIKEIKDGYFKKFRNVNVTLQDYINAAQQAARTSTMTPKLQKQINETQIPKTLDAFKNRYKLGNKCNRIRLNTDIMQECLQQNCGSNYDCLELAAKFAKPEIWKGL